MSEPTTTSPSLRVLPYDASSSRRHAAVIVVSIFAILIGAATVIGNGGLFMMWLTGHADTTISSLRAYNLGLADYYLLSYLVCAIRGILLIASAIAALARRSFTWHLLLTYLWFTVLHGAMSLGLLIRNIHHSNLPTGEAALRVSQWVGDLALYFLTILALALVFSGRLSRAWIDRTIDVDRNIS